ncbi:MAG TPA: multidrug efflux SMR transporter [Paucimonas sp.]|nr:multidrug efflux SMR transporter [Paucimonas sp.]
MSWIYLIVASVFEIGWPVGFKLSQTLAHQRALWIAFALVCMALSGFFLWLAQRDIPIGTAYAAWTGIGAAGTFLVGIWFFGDAASLGRWLGAVMIIGGVITLKLAN